MYISLFSIHRARMLGITQYNTCFVSFKVVLQIWFQGYIYYRKAKEGWCAQSSFQLLDIDEEEFKILKVHIFNIKSPILIVTGF